MPDSPISARHASTTGAVTIKIDPAAGGQPVSPYLYGRNFLLTTAEIDEDLLTQISDSGLAILRLNGGNNASKYNWKKKLTSHPDWYNNVYTNDWDSTAMLLQQKLPDVQGMWALPLLGKVAKTNQYNFNEWKYNKAQWWQGIRQNLAGNGVLNPVGDKKALKDGYPDLYLEDWSDDDAVGILDHWFGSNGIGLSRKQFQFWNMDNEPDIWYDTHDDVMPCQLSAEEFMEKYFSVAKKARAKYPFIKLAAPVAANEWMWYRWDNKTIVAEGNDYTWLEYFIKRVSEEQRKSGTRLLDVLDIHFYPQSQKVEEVVQMHRVFFDRTYDYPGAAGIKYLQGHYDESQCRELIFERCSEWLEKYMGAGHSVTFGVSETGIKIDDPNAVAVWYASTMGEFMKHGVELFTPWDWKQGMWETAHLFSRYNRNIYVNGTSTDEHNVSVYATINTTRDAMTIVLVNRSAAETKNTLITAANFTFTDEHADALVIPPLPETETFISHQKNALIKSKLTISDNSIAVLLAPMSVCSICVHGFIHTGTAE